MLPLERFLALRELVQEIRAGPSGGALLVIVWGAEESSASKAGQHLLLAVSLKFFCSQHCMSPPVPTPHGGASEVPSGAVSH